MIRLLACLALTASLAACGVSCKDACDNIASVCADRFAGAPMNLNQCVDTCDGNPAGCKNITDQRKCAAEAKTCADFEKCPGCVQ